MDEKLGQLRGAESVRRSMEIFAGLVYGLVTPIMGQSHILCLGLLTLDDQLNAHFHQREGDISPDKSELDGLCDELAKHRNVADILDNRNPMPPVKLKRVVRRGTRGEVTDCFFHIAGHGVVVLTTRSPSRSLTARVDAALRCALPRLAVRMRQLDVERRAVDAVRDRLSSLLTRDAYQEETRRRFILASGRGAPISIAILDLDNFKKLNTVLGYQPANVVIASVGHLIVDSVDGVVVVGRFGGDEFMFTFDSDGELARRVLQRVLEGLPRLNPNFTDPSDRDKLLELGGCSASVGVATYRFGADLGGVDAAAGVVTLTKRANDALTEAKKLKNRIVLYEELAVQEVTVS